MKNKTERAARKAGAKPKPPFPRQHQTAPGLESKLKPRPRYEAAAYKAAGKLEGKTALITGGDSGIGRAVAWLYAREGARVAITYLPEEQSDADETKRIVESAGAQCLLLCGDLTDPKFCADAVKETVRELGALDILVSNAAHQRHKKSLDDLTDAELDRTFKTNVYAYFRLARAALKHMKPGAAIIATSSVTGIKGSKELPDYSATKGAINAFTKTLAQQLIARGVRVNAVAPGPVWTPLNPPPMPACPGKGGPLRSIEANRASGAAGGARARIRVSGFKRRLFLHHRHGAAGDGRRNDRRLTRHLGL